MHISPLLILMVLLFSACTPELKEKQSGLVEQNVEEIKAMQYELFKPLTDPKAVLILFGGFLQTAKDIKKEFDIGNKAAREGVAVIFMNYNQTLWLEEKDKVSLASSIKEILQENEVDDLPITIGGFSSGGNVALLLSNFLQKTDEELKLKGVFAVDSPIDLLALYHSAQKNVSRNFSETAVQEGKWIIQTLETRLGKPDDDLSVYEKYAVFTAASLHTSNLNELKPIKIRFYSEPDTLWWKEQRMADYDQMNAYYLNKLTGLLKEKGFKHVEYIQTKDQGYRSDGERHPHSWSIVNQDRLLEWIPRK